MRNLIFLLFSLFFIPSVFAQELNCEVQILTPQLQMTDPAIFKTLEGAMQEFMNNRKWTDDAFQPIERIDCKLIITISKELSNDHFLATANIQSSRPVFNSDYQSVMLNYADKDWDMSYSAYQPLEFNENANLSNITSMLAFYAYIIIGLDYDSFSEKGGDPYFLKAQSIVTNSSNVAQKGWKAFDGTRNRYWLIENLTNSKYDAFRKAYYQYHFAGLDHMYDNRNSATGEILKALYTIEKVYDRDPNIMIIQLFFNAKSDELVEIIRGASQSEKIKAVNLLSKLDAGNSEKYRNILKNR